MDTDRQPFLQNDKPLEYDCEPQLPLQTRYRLVRSPRFLHGALILFYTAVFAILASRLLQHSGARPALIYSPANNALEYEKKSYDEFPVESPFTGPPRPEQEKAWHNLLRNTIVRVSAEELANTDGTSVSLSRGGHMAALTVYHELHCLRAMQRQYHYHYYFPNETESHWEKTWEHVEHCFEVMRQAIMCSGDVSMYRYRWADLDDLKPTIIRTNQHQCVKWEKIEAWAAARRVVQITEELVRPQRMPDN